MESQSAYALNPPKSFEIIYSLSLIFWIYQLLCWQIFVEYMELLIIHLQEPKYGRKSEVGIRFNLYVLHYLSCFTAIYVQIIWRHCWGYALNRIFLILLLTCIVRWISVKMNENLVEIKDFYFVKVMTFHESIFVLCQGLGIWVDYPRSSFNPCR